MCYFSFVPTTILYQKSYARVKCLGATFGETQLNPSPRSRRLMKRCCPMIR
jgi:hypothetical protein